MTSQLGVMWITLRITGKPAHVLEASVGTNAITASYTIFQGLQELEAEWNRPEFRHPEFHSNPHPVNFNLGSNRGGRLGFHGPMLCDHARARRLLSGDSARDRQGCP
jgi:acetylornithine deacetylase